MVTYHSGPNFIESVMMHYLLKKKKKILIVYNKNQTEIKYKHSTKVGIKENLIKIFNTQRFVV